VFQVLLPTHEPHILPTILMLVKALEAQGVPCKPSPLRRKPFRALAKLAWLLKVRRLPASLQTSEPIFSQLNHAWPAAFFPYALRHPLVTYSFDLWPALWDEWQQVFEYVRPQIAFISAKGPLAEMAKRIPGIDFRWLPEAVEPEGFDPCLPLTARPIDVLEMGRTFHAFHERIREPLAAAQKLHQFPIPGLIAPTPYQEVVATLGRAKMTVVFPRATSHPEQAQGVETSTFRFFECMASKTLMLGHCPQELFEIFGYNPVVEANLDNPAEQLLQDILPHIANFQALVDRNHAALCSTWTVHHQARVIRQALDEMKNI
jgi:hypothetical protein